MPRRGTKKQKKTKNKKNETQTKVRMALRQRCRLRVLSVYVNINSSRHLPLDRFFLPSYRYQYQWLGTRDFEEVSLAPELEYDVVLPGVVWCDHRSFRVRRNATDNICYNKMKLFFTWEI